MCWQRMPGMIIKQASPGRRWLMACQSWLLQAWATWTTAPCESCLFSLSVDAASTHLRRTRAYEVLSFAVGSHDACHAAMTGAIYRVAQLGVSRHGAETKRLHGMAWHGMAMCYSEVHEATESRHSRVAWRRCSGESPVDVSALGRDVCTYIGTYCSHPTVPVRAICG